MPMQTIWSKFRFLLDRPGFRSHPLRTLGRLSLWRLFCLLRYSPSIRLKGLPLRMSLPPAWHGQAKLIYSLNWCHETDLLAAHRFVASGSVVVDVGSHIGLWSLVLSQAVQGAGKVVACEPADQAFRYLMRNIELNRIPNIFPNRIALSDKPGYARLYRDVDASRNSLGNDPAREHIGFEDVPTETLDSVLQRLGVSHVDLIKIDVEGAEELVLKGARETLHKSRPVVLFEINRQATASVGLAASGAWRLLEDMGYEFFELSEDSRLSPLPAPPLGGNVWACSGAQDRLERLCSALAANQA